MVPAGETERAPPRAGDHAAPPYLDAGKANLHGLVNGFEDAVVACNGAWLSPGKKKTQERACAGALSLPVPLQLPFPFRRRTFSPRHNLKARGLERVKANVDVVQAGLAQIGGAAGEGDAVGGHGNGLEPRQLIQPA